MLRFLHSQNQTSDHHRQRRLYLVTEGCEKSKRKPKEESKMELEHNKALQLTARQHGSQVASFL